MAPVGTAREAVAPVEAANPAAASPAAVSLCVASARSKAGQRPQVAELMQLTEDACNLQRIPDASSQRDSTPGSMLISFLVQSQLEPSPPLTVDGQCWRTGSKQLPFVAIAKGACSEGVGSRECQQWDLFLGCRGGEGYGRNQPQKTGRLLVHRMVAKARVVAMQNETGGKVSLGPFRRVSSILRICPLHMALMGTQSGECGFEWTVEM
ncbi:hypothetical protein ACRRTK_011214 [Alexandromys fortis]